MNNRNCKNGLVTLISCVWSFTTFAQITADHIQQFILENKHINNAEVKYATEVKEFYSRINYKTAWIEKENVTNRTIFFNILKLSPGMGLRVRDYQVNYIESFRNTTIRLQSKDDFLEAEVRITDAAIHFYSDIAYGNTKPAFGYNGLNYTPGCRNIPALLADYTSRNLLQLLITHLSLALPEINVLGNKKAGLIM